MTLFLPTGRVVKLTLAENCQERVAFLYEQLRFYNPSKAHFVKVTISVPSHLHGVLDYAPIAKGKIAPELLSATTRARLGKVQNEKLYPYLGCQVNKRYHSAHWKKQVDKAEEQQHVDIKVSMAIKHYYMTKKPSRNPLIR